MPLDPRDLGADEQCAQIENDVLDLLSLLGSTSSGPAIDLRDQVISLNGLFEHACVDCEAVEKELKLQGLVTDCSAGLAELGWQFGGAHEFVLMHHEADAVRADEGFVVDRISQLAGDFAERRGLHDGGSGLYAGPT